VRDRIQLGDLTIELVNDHAIIVRDAAARLGSTLQNLAERACDLPWNDVEVARRQLLRFARAVVG
jgi:hypothetical protein